LQLCCVPATLVLLRFELYGGDMLNKKLSLGFVCLGTVMASNSIADTSPADVFNNAWATVCTNVQGNGSSLDARCNENNLGGVNVSGIPADGGAAAGAGSNAGVSSGIGNSTVMSDQYNKKSLEKRKEKLKQEGAAGDILSGERLGFFASGMQTEIDRKDTTLEAGYDSDELGFTVGMDYIFSEKFVSGIAVSYSDTDLDYNGNAGSSDYESVSVLAYANYNVNDLFSVDGYLGWSGVDFDLGRNISYPGSPGGGGVNVNTSTTADADANKVLAGLNLAYAMPFDALTITPALKLDYSGTFIDSYAESGGIGLALKYDSQNIQSFKSNLGFDAVYAVSVPWGIVLPRIQAGYVHEFLNQRRTVHASFVQDTGNFDLQFETDKPDRDYFVIGAGISTVLTHSAQLFVNYERIEGNRYMNSYTVSGGVRVAF